MDRNYLLEEVIGSIDELKPFSDTFVILYRDDNDYEMLKTLREAELIVEHLASCIVALRRVI
jgi:hypothetical protein